MRPHAFLLTDSEQALLDLRREFHGTDKAFLAALGMHPRASNLAIAREKVRNQLLFEQTQDKSGKSSLSTARGRIRMEGTK